MSAYEYRVVPAPRKAKAERGVKGTPAKFANAIGGVMNALSAEGWEYLRADTLPCEERQGLTGKTVNYHSMLVFRRVTTAQDTEAPEDILALPLPEETADPEDEDQSKPGLAAE